MPLKQSNTLDKANKKGRVNIDSQFPETSWSRNDRYEVKWNNSIWNLLSSVSSIIY